MNNNKYNTLIIHTNKIDIAKYQKIVPMHRKNNRNFTEINLKVIFLLIISLLDIPISFVSTINMRKEDKIYYNFNNKIIEL